MLRLRFTLRLPQRDFTHDVTLSEVERCADHLIFTIKSEKFLNVLRNREVQMVFYPVSIHHV